MREDLIERLRNFEVSDDLGNGDFSLLREAAAALEEARGDATPPVTPPATSPVRILIDAIESEIRQLEGKADWKSQTARIASLRAAIDQARGEGVAGEA